MKARHLLVVAVLALTGCTNRPGPEVLVPVTTPLPDGAREVAVLAVTTRAADDAKGLSFGAGRAAAPRWLAYDVSIPPDHQKGHIEWPDADGGDPASDFTLRRQRSLTEAEFARAVGGKAIGVYVHGFNTRYQEALFRAAQLSADVHIEGVPILFAWPSAGNVGAYLADRDASDYSRTALADLLVTLTRGRSPDKPVPVLAHSMGARLTMETLAQLRLAGRRDVLDRIELLLAAPDIDLDLFRAQMAVVGRMRHPITVLVSSDDPALKISSRLSSRRVRLGLADVLDPKIQALALENGIRIVDITQLATEDTAHSRYVGLLSGEGGAEIGNPLEGVRQVGAFVFNGVGGVFQGIGGALGN